MPPVEAGDFLALMSAGAYGSVMASNYNSRPMPAEVLVQGAEGDLVRERQPIEDLWRLERVPNRLAETGSNPRSEGETARQARATGST
jgi:diaminopimelate decarboxylase